jgi:DNA mismatch endonuclease (patch repair protein)
MAAVPQANSKPELAVRRMIHALGYRFRIHRRDLPGTPDIVLPRHRKVVFVHGCYWHRHGCKKTTSPSSNSSFWEKKFAENRARDSWVVSELERLGWRSLVIWECQVARRDWLLDQLVSFLTEPQTESIAGHSSTL